MNPAQLIKMANQIGAFFEAMPDQTQAAQDVASHIRRNWESRMTQAFLGHLDSQGEGDLKPVVRTAAGLLRQSSTSAQT